MSRNCVKHILDGLFSGRNKQFDKSMSGKEGHYLSLPTPLQHYQEDNSTFVAHNADARQLVNKMIIAL